MKNILRARDATVESTSLRLVQVFCSSGFPPPSVNAIIHNNIRRLRFEHHMTQEELALRTGVSRQTVMSIERGQTNPSILLACKIAMAFGVPVTDVFYMEGRLAPV